MTRRTEISSRLSRFFLSLYGAIFTLAGLICSVGFLERYCSRDGIIDPSNWKYITAGRGGLIVLGLLLLAAAIRQEGIRRRFSRFPSLVARIGLLCTSVLFCFLVLEAGTRIYLYGRQENLVSAIQYQRPSFDDPEAELRTIDIIRLSDNRKLVYELIPGSIGIYKGVPLELNERGQRGPVYPYEKPEGTFRIVSIGDSVAFGFGVEEEETYMRILEKLLKEAGYGCEVINLAVPGYNTAMEVELLASEGLRYDPDLVLLSFCGNDFHLPNYLRAGQDFTLLNKSFFYDHFLKGRKLSLYRHVPIVRGFEYAPWKEDGRGNRYFLPAPERVPPQYRYMVGEEGVKEAFGRLQRAGGGIPLVVHSYKKNIEGIPEKGKCGSGPVQAFLEEFCSDFGFSHCDSTAALCRYAAGRGRSFRELFYLAPDDPHPSKLANQLIAEDLKEFLLAHDLIKGQQTAR